MKLIITNQPKVAKSSKFTTVVAWDADHNNKALQAKVRELGIGNKASKAIKDALKGGKSTFHLHIEHDILFVGFRSSEVGYVKQKFLEAISPLKDRLDGGILLYCPEIDFKQTKNLQILEQMVCGLNLGIARAFTMKSGRKTSKFLKFLIEGQTQKIRQAAVRGVEKAATTQSIINLVNRPSNVKTPIDLARWLKKSGKKYGYKVTVLEIDKLKRLGFHALLAVNRGSEVPAKCLIARYRPNKSKGSIPKVCLVGKGITFDTGGLSIKGAKNMHYMKSDMGGAAAVMGTIELVAKLRLNVDLTVIIPTTDNSVDALSIKPGDVISSYSGKSIEVIDTDAEGRLVLADGLGYAIDVVKPDFLIDLATLTGSVVRALGTEAAGMMTENEELARSLYQCGIATGDRVWRLPMLQEYDKYMDSDIADVSNLSYRPMAGAITAGMFLRRFVKGHQAWAHLDIAGTAFGNHPSTRGYSASGYGIDLLTSWIKKTIK